MHRLDGKVAVVTGGASGIGAATSRRFVDEGASVLVADLQEDLGESFVAELNEQRADSAAFHRVNVATETDVAEAVATAHDRWGSLDIMFNNAGFGGAMGPISSIAEDDYDLTMNVLLKGVFFGIKHAAPIMSDQGSGSIINTASICGVSSGWGTHLYSVAKAGVISLTETSAIELAENDVRVNAVCPGNTVTALFAAKPGADEDRLDRARQSAMNMQPIQRPGEAEDIANLVLFLASDESDWITGQAHVIDGGLTLGRAWRDQPEWMREHHPIRLYRPPSSETTAD